MSTSPELNLINPKTQATFKVTQKMQFFSIGNEVVIGDLYTDPTDSTYSFISVIRKISPVDINTIIPAPEHNRRESDIV